MKIDQMPSHRNFYTAHLIQAFEFYLGEQTPELAWMLVEDLGLARLFGVEITNVFHHLKESPGLVSSPDKLDIVKDILHAEGQPTSNLAGLKDLIQQAFEDVPSLDLNEVIDDYLQNLEHKIMDEWEEEDDEIIIFHTSTVAAYQWLAEKIMGNEYLLPMFIEDLDKLGTMLVSITQTIRSQIHNFLAGQAVAKFMYEGAVKDYLTQNFIFLSDEFLSIKAPDFVLPLPLGYEDVYMPAQTASIGEPREPWLKEGMDDWSRVSAEEPWKGELVKNLVMLQSSKSLTAYSGEYGLDVGRGDTDTEVQKRGIDQYAIGDRMVFCVEAPDNGHMVIFHCDQTGKVQLVFPHSSIDNTFVSGGSEKRIRGTVTKPSGRQLFKAIWTSRQLLEPGKVDFDDELEIEKTIARFIHALAQLGEDDWQEVLYEFEAVEV